MNDSIQNHEMKQCLMCKTLLPSTDDYFIRQNVYHVKGGKRKLKRSYLTSPCKECNRLKRSKRTISTRRLCDDYLATDWMLAYFYFNGQCAVCKKRTVDGKLQADHWIPLKVDPVGHKCTNILPLCSYCNTSKGSKLPDVWLKKKYGDEQAEVISCRIEHFFEWVI